MLSRKTYYVVGGRIKSFDIIDMDIDIASKRNTKDTGISSGTKEEEARLKQMKINMETARRQGDQDTVKEIKEAIEELEASIKRSTSSDSDIDIVENKGYADVEIDEPTQALLTLFSSDQIINDHEVFHILAEKLGMDPSELEEKAYAMLQSFFSKGKSSESSSNNIPDPSELAMGDIVELEHTTNPLFARKIALDHIAEIPNYYTLLAQIEKGETKDASPLLTCKHCKSTFAVDHVISHMKKFNHDKSFMTTKHCPNCDRRISLKDENPDIEAMNKRIMLLNKYGAQCRMNGNREEYESSLSEIKDLGDLILKIREGKSL